MDNPIDILAKLTEVLDEAYSNIKGSSNMEDHAIDVPMAPMPAIMGPPKTISPFLPPMTRASAIVNPEATYRPQVEVESCMSCGYVYKSVSKCPICTTKANAGAQFLERKV